MEEIQESEIAKRIQTLGYNYDNFDKTYPNGWKPIDIELISISKKKGMEEVSIFCNREKSSFVSAMRPFVLDIICGIFLDSKRSLGSINEDEGGSISTIGSITAIREGSSEVRYGYSGQGGSSTNNEVDKIQELFQNAYQNLQRFRCFYNIGGFSS